jgi:hypothetical protein
MSFNINERPILSITVLIRIPLITFRFSFFYLYVDRNNEKRLFHDVEYNFNDVEYNFNDVEYNFNDVEYNFNDVEYNFNDVFCI